MTATKNSTTFVTSRNRITQTLMDDISPEEIVTLWAKAEMTGRVHNTPAKTSQLKDRAYRRLARVVPKERNQ